MYQPFRGICMVVSAFLLLQFCTLFADQKDRGLWERDGSFLVTLIKSCAHEHLVAKQRKLRNKSQKAASPACVTQETFCNRHRNLSKLKICGSQTFLTFRINFLLTNSGEITYLILRKRVDKTSQK